MGAQTVLVTGGAGFIGAHAAWMLERRGYKVIIFDRVSNPTLGMERAVWVQGDLGNQGEIEAVCSAYPIDAVMHFAAYIDVGESVVDPAKYYINNVLNSLNLFEAMRRHKILRCIFSSSAAIFGAPERLPVAEDHPCHPVNPYGEGKWIVEKVLRDYDRAYGLKSSSLRYFNAAGGDPEGRIKIRKHKESNLIPLALNALIQETPLTVFGSDYPTPDGTCIRDYIHVEDIGQAHLLALEKLLKEGATVNYNLGNGKGYSVREVLAAVERVTRKKLRLIEGPRRAGDVPVLVADASKARAELGWVPRYPDLEAMIQDAWRATQP